MKYAKTSDLIIELIGLLAVDSVRRSRDAIAFLPDVEWVGKFTEWRQRLRQDNEARRYRLQKWTQEKADCDDWALEALMDASDCIMEAPEIKDCGHGFCYCEVALGDAGLMGVFPEGPNVNHALNIVRCSDGNWYFYEPQNDQFTPAENALADGRVRSVLWVWL